MDAVASTQSSANIGGGGVKTRHAFWGIQRRVNRYRGPKRLQRSICRCELNSYYGWEGKRRCGSFHSWINAWLCNCACKLRDPLTKRATPERFCDEVASYVRYLYVYNEIDYTSGPSYLGGATAGGHLSQIVWGPRLPPYRSKRPDTRRLGREERRGGGLCASRVRCHAVWRTKVFSKRRCRYDSESQSEQPSSAHRNTVAMWSCLRYCIGIPDITMATAVVSIAVIQLQLTRACNELTNGSSW